MAIGIFTLRQQLRGLLSKNWTGTIKTPYVEYLVVGGGGGGGSMGGGGGGGGVLTGLLPVTTGATNNVTVGGGGAGSSSSSVVGSNGQNSILNSIIAVGGGGGASYGAIPPGSGGSGGGAAYPNFRSIGNGIFGQGNTGAPAAASNSGGSGGGGGAGTVGLSDTSGGSGRGGAGISSAISGTVTPYGGGGGGGVQQTLEGDVFGPGGVGGGGAGGNYNTAATIGQANTGGGGGGGGYTNAGPVFQPGAAGGSGIVIVSYPDIYAPLTTGGATSPTVSTSGSGSIYVNGSGSYLSFADSAAFYFDADYTVEAWVYIDGGTTSGQAIVNQRSGGGTGVQFLVNWTGSVYQMGVWFNAAVPVSGGNSIPASTWTHLAWCRQGSTLRTFINGVLNQTGTFATAIDIAAVLTVGGDAAGFGQDFKGYLSNVRLVKGAAVYTGAFSSYLPTGPFTATQPAGPSGSNINAITGTQTSLLLNTVSGASFADSSTNSFTATKAGSTAWNQQSPFATGLGYKNRVYTWVNGGGAGTSATGTFTV